MLTISPIKHYNFVATCNVTAEMSLLWTSGNIQDILQIAMPPSKS